DARPIVIDMVRRVADAVFLPFTVGGGVRSVEDADGLLRAGADKVAVNTAAVDDPALLERLALRFGSQAVVLAIDARRRGGGRGAPAGGGPGRMRDRGAHDGRPHRGAGERGPRRLRLPLRRDPDCRRQGPPARVGRGGAAVSVALPDGLAYDAAGLIPGVVQGAASGAVLMGPCANR